MEFRVPRHMQFHLVHIFISLSFLLHLSMAQNTTMTRDSECYTPNGNDYEGTQNVTYIRGDASFEPSEVYSEDCLPWTGEHRKMLNTTAEKLPKNYCRNPNNRLFPWCYVMRDGAPTFSYCHIPTCNTPAYLGCFKLVISGSLTDNTTDVDLILDGDDSMNDDPEMRIARCLNFCRSRKYDYGGLTGGDTCMCGTRKQDGPQLKEVLNQRPPHDCLVMPCADDKMQACGSDTAIAIYDVEAGSCEGTYHDRPSGVIYSPRWPGDYHNEAQCGWTVYVPDQFRKTEEMMARHKLVVSFSYFHLEETNDTLQIYSYKNATDTSPEEVQTYSGKVQNPANITLAVSEVFAIHVVFNSDPDGRHDGFILHYDVIATSPPATTTTTTASTTTTPRRTTTLPQKPTNPTGITLSTSKSTTTTTPKAPEAGKSTTTVKATTTKNGTNPDTPGAAKQSSSQGGKIAGIVLGVMVILVLLILGVTAFLKYRKHKAEKEAATPNPPPMFDNPVSFPTDTTL